MNKMNKNWIMTTWRPAMAWMYMVVCIFDFIIFPIMWSIIQIAHKGNVTSQWNPLTLIGAGLFHMAMGAVLGVTAWGRTREKLNDTVEQPTAISIPTNIDNNDNIR